MYPPSTSARITTSIRRSGEASVSSTWSLRARSLNRVSKALTTA